MNKRTFILRNNSIRQRAIDEIWGSPDGYAVTIPEETRNLEQNAAQWPILDAFSRQLLWPVGDMLVYLSADAWKDILTAAFQRESIQVVPGLDGGVVMLGLRTSEMSKSKFSEWIEFLNATAADRGVNL